MSNQEYEIVKLHKKCCELSIFNQDLIRIIGIGYKKYFFFAPLQGGYVKYKRDAEINQICERLQRLGKPLECSEDEDLSEVIEREIQMLINQREIENE